MTERPGRRRVHLRHAVRFAGAVALGGLAGPQGTARAEEGGAGGAPGAGTAPAEGGSVPEPPGPDRPLERGADGVLTAGGRPPGALSPAITPTDAHYVVTKNAIADPILDAATWRLIIDGEVSRPVQVDFATLRRLPAVEQTKTLECISNLTAMCELAAFGCDLISTAVWRGARLADVLALAGGLRPGTSRRTG